MAVEKMHFINIMGPKDFLDQFVIDTITPYNIQLVNAMTILDDVKGIYNYSEPNPYDNLLKKIKGLMDKIGGIDLFNQNTSEYQKNPLGDSKQLEAEINHLVNNFDEKLTTKIEIIEQLKRKNTIKKQLLPIKDLDVDLQKIFNFKFMKFRFGSMPRYNYDKLKSYVDNLDVVVYKVFAEEDKVYVIYFTPESFQQKIDSLFSSMYFQRIFISGEVKGTPSQALKKLNDEIEFLENKLQTLENDIGVYGSQHLEEVKNLYFNLVRYNQIFSVRKYAAHSNKAFYLTGWVGDSELRQFENALDKYHDISFIVEDADTVQKSAPPTKLRNNKFFKPFQSIVEMYGLPSYSEFDPTPFVAITYMLMFGMMFGDSGQGLVLILLGYLMFKKNGNMLGKVISMAGISSTIFGIIYGSFFGMEEINGKQLPRLIAPMEEQYTILGIAVFLGVILIVTAMIFNIINLIRNRKLGNALFNKNGVAGLVFYLALIGLALDLLLQKNVLSNPIFIVTCIVLPIILIFLEQPLANILAKRKKVLPEDKGGFFIEAIFELLETLLSILSNSISFVRVGAFALNHVGLFMAFHVLASMQGTVGSIIVNILGNILIIGLEGLIVGIQGLRLEYYELFSRFFNGEGKSFKPFKINYNIEN